MNSRLETRLLNYFFLIAFAATLIGVEFFFEIGNNANMEETRILQQQVGNQTKQHGTTAPADLIKLRNKIAIMFGVLTLVVAIVLMMFIKNITMPLCKIADAAKCINDGDLSQIVPIETDDEIGQVATAINELTSNLQEVASFTASTVNETLELIDAQMVSADNGQPNPHSMDDIRKNLESLISFVDSFKLLHTEIDN